MPSQAYQTSQYAVSRGGIFPGKWRSYFVESSDGKMNGQSACALNARYKKLPRCGAGWNILYKSVQENFLQHCY
jgi:hypothetical protein